MNCIRLSIVICILIVFARPAFSSEVRVSVALSFQEAIQELVALYEQKTKGTKIICNYGTSQELAKQISAGAPVDMFISAHQQWTDYLKIGGFLDEMFLNTLASNTLVFIGNSGRNTHSMQDLRSLNLIAIGNPVTTAHGQYTVEAIRHSGMESELGNRLVVGNNHDNLQRVEKGEVDGAIIYRSEVRHLKKTKILFTIPPALHSPIIYQLALTKSSVNGQSTRQFYKFLNSSEAKPVFIRHGFTVK